MLSSGLGRSATLVALVCAALACAHPREEAAAPDAPRVLARVGGAEITEAEVDEALRGQLLQMEIEYTRSVYNNRRRMLDHLIDSRLVLDEAARREITPTELMRIEVRDKIEETPEAELRELYDRYRESGLQGSFEERREQLLEYALGQGRELRKRELVAQLRADAQIEILLPLPDLPLVEIPGGASGPARGTPDAPVTIIEFSDFECPYCKRIQPVLAEIIEAYPERVRLVYRHFPLSSHPMAQQAAEASACAEEQGQFWTYHDLLFEQQSALSPETLIELAAATELDLEAFQGCVDDGRYRERVLTDVQAGREAGVQGTPAFFVNGRAIFGASSVESFRELIDRELERGVPST